MRLPMLPGWAALRSDPELHACEAGPPHWTTSPAAFVFCQFFQDRVWYPQDIHIPFLLCFFLCVGDGMCTHVTQRVESGTSSLELELSLLPPF